MPRYEYRCRTCGDTFELSRPMSESASPAACPAGHPDTVKLLSTVAVTGSGASSPAPAPSSGGGGGCCGGGCCG
ncbi:FmdB family zinc ribbon protein [Streptomyces sp. cg35]|uniref:FmdB family zinc ribbon protein n=1 Tax=Streptomyces sp. cg35 TaxID=3421650 RepID=UPI003D16DE91